MTRGVPISQLHLAKLKRHARALAGRKAHLGKRGKAARLMEGALARRANIELHHLGAGDGTSVFHINLNADGSRAGGSTAGKGHGKLWPAVGKRGIGQTMAKRPCRAGGDRIKIAIPHVDALAIENLAVKVGIARTQSGIPQPLRPRFGKLSTRVRIAV